MAITEIKKTLGGITQMWNFQVFPTFKLSNEPIFKCNRDQM